MNIPKIGIVAGALVVVCLVLAGAVSTLWARLETAASELHAERIAHNATRGEYATAEGLWLLDQRNRNATIAGLAGQVNATFGVLAKSQTAATSRAEIMSGALCVPAATGVFSGDAASGFDFARGAGLKSPALPDKTLPSLPDPKIPPLHKDRIFVEVIDNAASARAVRHINKSLGL